MRDVTIEETEAPPGARGGYPPVLVPLPDRDVRRKRPPLLSFLLRLETFRRVARVISLLAIDYLGVMAALFTALGLKVLLTGDPGGAAVAWHQTRQWSWFAYLM
ncbi:MAG TPA: hypothetical protein VE992_01705, partial [Solirubrobacteraceae bacterium]|nr:hypothetical protein [Solirubrobacteraceae bacterium]